MSNSACYLYLLGEGLVVCWALVEVFHLRKQLCLWNSVLFLFGLVKYLWIPAMFAKGDLDTKGHWVHMVVFCWVFFWQGVAARIIISQLHLGRPRERSKLHWLLQWWGQAIPHFWGRWPAGEDLGLPGMCSTLQEPLQAATFGIKFLLLALDFFLVTKLIPAF